MEIVNGMFQVSGKQMGVIINALAEYTNGIPNGGSDRANAILDDISNLVPEAVESSRKFAIDRREWKEGLFHEQA